MDKHPFNAPIVGRLTAGSFVTIPELCYASGGQHYLPQGCQTTNDCTNGNANGVCGVRCKETAEAFACVCADGKAASGAPKCSPRYANVAEKPQPIFCVPATCASGTGTPMPGSSPCDSMTTNSCRGPSVRCVPQPQSSLGYTCQCSDARYAIRNLECVDVDECTASAHSPCAGPGALCVNESPGYHCECGPGFVASSTRQSCVPTEQYCAAQCINSQSCRADASSVKYGVQCVCAAGQSLLYRTCIADGTETRPCKTKSCVKPATCIAPPSGDEYCVCMRELLSQRYCSNTRKIVNLFVGPNGYQVNNDTVSCSDIDECAPTSNVYLAKV